ncbi:hypothetical protein GOBAR_DD05516 [Gossypium barbadense]|nr:hypothetical protein GOBAR_DD05516 [Gossypium barbadense]
MALSEEAAESGASVGDKQWNGTLVPAERVARFCDADGVMEIVEGAMVLGLGRSSLLVPKEGAIGLIGLEHSSPLITGVRLQMDSKQGAVHWKLEPLWEDICTLVK